MFSYQSNLPINLNNSIRMSDGQVMVKTLSWGQRENRTKLPVGPEKFQFLEKWQNRNFDYKVVNFG